MDDPIFETIGILHSVVTVVLILAYIGVIAVVLLRLKKTLSGLLLAAGYAGFLLVILLVKLLVAIVPPESVRYVGYVADSLDFIISLVVAVGIGFIPRSFRKANGLSG